VPGFFKDVHILTEPGYNVAYWNLHERRVDLSADGLQVNGQPLYFFHFSGIQLNSLDRVSKYQNRFNLGDLGETASLFHQYRELLMDAGYEDSSRWKYAFGTFEDGAPIRDKARKRYLELGPGRSRFGNPFEIGSPGSFRAWYRGERLPRVLRWLYRIGLMLIDSAPGRSMWITLRRALGRPLDTKSPRSQVPRSIEGSTLDSLEYSEARPPAVVPAELARPGVNLVGYFDAESGMGEVARALGCGLASASIRFEPHNVGLNVHSRREDESDYGDGVADFPYDVNLFCINADQAPQVMKHLGREVRKGRRNVGYWLWELSTFPEKYVDAFEYFDEIWTPSAHCVEAIAAVSSVPVRRVPLPVCVPNTVSYGRGHFGIPEPEFALLFAFDFLSFWERKNPLAVIRAFQRAFLSDESARLVLKSSNSSFDPEGRARIATAIDGARVTWIDETLSRQEVNDLFRVCDGYVSLHHAESFGLTIAEAMALGKPVIATTYSGNVDFFNLNNGWPVRYELVELKRDVGPYPAGAVWADPDIDHAAKQMRSVYEDPKDREVRTRRAREDIRRHLSYEAVGAVLRERLRALALARR
jgi:glycosyltransferase involved in cell wall biosynthesis